MVQLLIQVKESNAFVLPFLEENIDFVDPVAILSRFIRAVAALGSSDS